MPKAILEFELPEEAMSFDSAVKGSSYLQTLVDIQDHIALIKAQGEEISLETQENLSHINRLISEALNAS